MAQLTKRAIIETTLRLLEKKPLQKITVRDIVDACGITRNTFYYYFHDIYDVFDAYISMEVEQKTEEVCGDYDRLLFALVSFCVENKKIWSNLYRALGREQLSAYILKRLHKIIMNRLLRECPDGSVNESDLEIISAFYEEALVGIMMRWLRDDKKARTPEEIRQLVERVSVLFSGQLHTMLENGKNHPF